MARRLWKISLKVIGGFFKLLFLFTHTHHAAKQNKAKKAHHSKQESQTKKTLPKSLSPKQALNPGTTKQTSGLSSQIPTGFEQPSFLGVNNQLLFSLNQSLCVTNCEVLLPSL